MAEFAQLLISGLAVGSIYGLVALGFVLIFKATDVFNFAQGDLLMLGAFMLVTALTALKLPLGLAMLATLVAAALIGLALQQLVLRPMLGKPLLTVVMVTLALSLIIRAVGVIVYGPGDRALSSKLPDDTLDVWGVRISTLDLIVMGIAFACVLGFGLFFRYSSVGLHMRATAESAEVAALCGINSQRMFAAAFAIGTAMAATGGILIANLQVVTHSLSEFGLAALPAAVIGGLTSIPGAVVGGLLVGVIGQLAAGYVSSDAAAVFVYGTLLAVLLIRPYGLFGSKEAVRV